MNKHVSFSVVGEIFIFPQMFEYLITQPPKISSWGCASISHQFSIVSDRQGGCSLFLQAYLRKHARGSTRCFHYRPQVQQLGRYSPVLLRRDANRRRIHLLMWTASRRRNWMKGKQMYGRLFRVVAVADSERCFSASWEITWFFTLWI